jgi:hypothetical protein
VSDISEKRAGSQTRALGTVSRKSLCWSFEKKNIGSFRLTMALQKDEGFSIANP